MKDTFNTLLSLAGFLAGVGTVGCALVTFVDNPGSVMATGIFLALTALGCFALRMHRNPTDRIFFIVVGVLPTLAALADLLFRAAHTLLAN